MSPKAYLRSRHLTLILYISAIALLVPALAAETVRRGSSAWGPGAETVTVAREGLVHTAQLLATDPTGKMAGSDAAAQTRQSLDNLQAALAASGSRLSAVVKLNLYVKRGDDIAAVLEIVKQRFPADAPPAISLVETALPHHDALVAVDAVATQSEGRPESAVVLYPSPANTAHRTTAQAALLPNGPRVYISGQAAREGDLQRATVAALNLLRQNLEFLGLDLSDTVQVKSFLKPMSAAFSVAETIGEFFGGKTPPLVFVEWSNAEPIEIELIAAASGQENTSTEPLRYLTPPGEKASPVFCRIVRVDHPATIYFSGVYGDGADGPGQIRSAFARLGSAAAHAGTDLRHLVKATYYVTTDEVGQQLTDIRKVLYDPTRPPAASKATVRGTGAESNAFSMDMIAVPAAHTAAH